MTRVDITGLLSQDDWSWTTLFTYYDGSRFIESALNSVGVALQHLVDRCSPEHHVEIVIVDDCSSEGESAKLREVADRVTLPASCGMRITRLAANGGVSAARYEGLRRTGRSFVHMMDQDDEVKPDFYVSVLTSYYRMKAGAEQPTMWIAGCEYIDSEGKAKGAYCLGADRNSDRRLNDVDRWLSAGSQVRSPGMVVLSPSLRDDAERYFGLLDRGVDGSDDYWMFIYLLKRGARCAILREIGFRYRGHEHNQSVGHDFLNSAQRGLVIMNKTGVLSPREYTIVAARYRLLARLQERSLSKPMKLLVYLSAPIATWRLLRARSPL